MSMPMIKHTATPRRHRNVAKLLARLGPRAPNLVPRKGGRHVERWEIEDGSAIAAALGMIAARGPGLAMAVMVLCLRWWPDSMLGPETIRRRDARLSQAVRPAMMAVHSCVDEWLRRKIPVGTMPPKIQRQVRDLMEQGLPAALVLDEYVTPNHCPRCHGYGEILRQVDEKGRPVAPAIVACPRCIGQGLIARSVTRRAKALKIRTTTFHRYMQPAHESALGMLRHMEYRAASALVRTLGD